MNVIKDVRKRPNLKMKLPDRPDSWEVMAILSRWKKQRLASTNLIRAIRVYATLLQGDTSTLLEYFPQFGFGLPAPQRRPSTPPPMQISVSEPSQQAADDGIDDVLGDLEF